MTAIVDVIRAAIPDASKDTADYILWNRTPYPMGKITARAIYKAASSFDRAGRNGVALCDFCDNKAADGGYTCASCDAALRAAQDNG